MGFYRNVDMRMWGDERFRKLSKPQPNAQTLWVYLLTGNETGPVPGFIVAGAAGLAEALGWDVKPFRERFLELSSNGMAKADWEARFVWLPNGIRHNEPANPNIVKGWLPYLDGIPECDLKNRAIGRLWRYLQGRGESFAEPFRKRFGEPLLERYAKQDQDQEEDQEKDQDQEEAGESKSPSADADPPSGSDAPLPRVLQSLWNETAAPVLPRWRDLTPKRRAAAQARLRERPIDGEDGWRAVIARISASPFCRGENDRGWKASPDWLLQPDTATKVLEGKYDRSGKGIRTGYVHYGADDDAKFGKGGDITDEF